MPGWHNAEFALSSTRKPETLCRPRFRILAGKEIALGPGKADLLAAIDRTGSISAAARQLGLSYRRAWDLADTMNRCFRQPLVERTQGGKGGGGTRLTPLGRRTLKRYRAMETKAQKAATPDWQRIRRALKKSTPRKKR